MTRYAPLPTRALVESVLALYDSATPAQRDAGELWYQDALSQCEELARQYGITTDTACGVVAALSPNLRWDRNIRAARAILSGGTSEAYPANEYKARRIAAGESPLDVLGGLKVRAFYANIASGGYDTAVTVDGHAFNAAYGLLQPVKSANVTVRQHRALTTAYRAAARLRGITPPAMQATVWVVWTTRVLGDTRYAHRSAA